MVCTDDVRVMPFDTPIAPIHEEGARFADSFHYLVVGWVRTRYQMHKVITQ